MNTKNYFAPIFIMLILLSACVVRSEPTQNSLGNNNGDVNLTSTPATAIPISTPTSFSSITDTPQSSTWEIVDNWTPANQIRTMIIDRSGDLWTGGPAGVVHWNLKTGEPTIYAIHADPENTNVVALSQTPDGAIWAGTFGNGLARFDGTGWQSFTAANGLPSNYIISQTITSRGDLWFTIQKNKYSMEGHFGRLNGNKWIPEYGGAFDHIVALSDGSIVGTYNYPYTSGFFPSTIGIYDGHVWNEMDVVTDGWIGAVTVAPNGVIWFATRNTVYHYVNQIWKEIRPPWVEKDFPQVSSIAVSADDVAWFGFSLSRFDIDRCGNQYDDFEEKGVYRYDRKTWTHFTADDGLVDNKICTIILDSIGNAWFGSFDKGVSRFDGHEWKTYVIR
jgi:hypothetical protein